MVVAGTPIAVSGRHGRGRDARHAAGRVAPHRVGLQLTSGRGTASGQRVVAARGAMSRSAAATGSTPGRPAGVRLRPAAPQRRHVRRPPPPQAPPGAARRLGPQGPSSATRRGKAPVLAQVAGIALDDDTIASVAAALGSSRQPVAIDQARLDRQIRELALEHAAGSLTDEAYLARLKVLRQQRDAVTERTAAGLPADRGLEWLRALGESLQAPEKPKEKADVLHAIYDRITVAGPEIVGVRLTQAATRTAWRWRCPKRLNWRARQGVERALATPRSRSRAGVNGWRRRGGWRGSPGAGWSRFGRDRHGPRPRDGRRGHRGRFGPVPRLRPRGPC
jgi:hypothetical protein